MNGKKGELPLRGRTFCLKVQTGGVVYVCGPDPIKNLSQDAQDGPRDEISLSAEERDCHGEGSGNL